MADFEALTEIHLEAGISMFTEEPFVAIRAIGEKGTVLRGQLDPELCQEQGIIFLAAAEAALQDGAIWNACKKLELPEEMAGLLIDAVRDARKP